MTESDSTTFLILYCTTVFPIMLFAMWAITRTIRNGYRLRVLEITGGGSKKLVERVAVLERTIAKLTADGAEAEGYPSVSPLKSASSTPPGRRTAS